MPITVELPGGGWYGETPVPVNNQNLFGFGPDIGLATASTNRVAFCFRAPRAGTLHSFELRMGTVFNNPANGLRFSFQDGTSGANSPDGVEDQYRVIPSPGPFVSNQWLAPPGPLTHDGTNTGNKRVVVAKERVFCVARFENFVAGNDIGFKTLNVEIARNPPFGRGPYFPTRFAGGVWTTQTGGLIIAVRYDDGYKWINPLYLPIHAVTSVNFNSGSAPNEIGLRFKNPFNGKLDGCVIRLSAVGTLARCNVNLYDNSNTLLAQYVMNPNENDTPTGAPTWMYIPFERTIELTANTVYRLVVQPTVNTANWNLEYFDVPSNDYFDCFSGGREWYYTSRTGAGAWTDVTTRRPWAAIHVGAVPPVGGIAGGSFAAIG